MKNSSFARRSLHFWPISCIFIPLILASMAHRKAGGSAKNLRDSQPKYLGVKRADGQTVATGEIIVRQRGTKIEAGKNVKVGKDHTLFATTAGTVSLHERLALMETCSSRRLWTSSLGNLKVLKKSDEASASSLFFISTPYCALSVTDSMTIGSTGTSPAPVCVREIASITSIPSTTRPNTGCFEANGSLLKSSPVLSTVLMKN